MRDTLLFSGFDWEEIMILHPRMAVLAFALILGACGDDISLGHGDGSTNSGLNQTPGQTTCDPTLICTQALTCVEGQLYPTGCGPRNCDKAIGPCPNDTPDAPAPACDPTLMCGQALSCVNGQQYPTTCGPKNCDKPIGPCPSDEPDGAAPACDPTLMCGQALSCVNGQQYPTTCGPKNCDKPIGPC